MTERERYPSRGYAYLSAGDYQQCVAEPSRFFRPFPAHRRVATRALERAFPLVVPVDAVPVDSVC